VRALLSAVFHAWSVLSQMLLFKLTIYPLDRHQAIFKICFLDHIQQQRQKRYLSSDKYLFSFNLFL